MGLNMWHAEDVARVLNAIEETANCFPPSQFQTGWFRCLVAVRAGFGLSPATIAGSGEYRARQVLTARGAPTVED